VGSNTLVYDTPEKLPAQKQDVNLHKTTTANGPPKPHWVDTVVSTPQLQPPSTADSPSDKKE